MKRFALFIIAFAWLVACDTPSAPSSRGSAGAGPAFDRTHFNQSFPVSGLLFNSCPPAELLSYEGRLHINEVFETAPDGSVTDKFHLNTQGISGVGLTTGQKYQVIQNTKDDFSFTPNPLAVDETFDVRFRLIRQGSLDNLWLRFTFKFTYPPGDFVIIRDEVECRG